VSSSSDGHGRAWSLGTTQGVRLGPAEPPNPDHEHSVSNLDDLVASIDLRTIDLSPGRPRIGIERHFDDALGISRPDDPIDQLLRPPPARGIDGPDLGLGL